MTAFKWIIYAQRMVFSLDSIPTQRKYRELISHQMISNARAWWEGMEESLDDQQLVKMTIVCFRELFEAQFIPDTTHEIIRNQFIDFCLGGMGVQAFAKRGNELALFAPEDVVTNDLRVSCFMHAIRDDLQMMCSAGTTQIYTSHSTWAQKWRLFKSLLGSLMHLEEDLDREEVFSKVEVQTKLCHMTHLIKWRQ